MTTTIMEVEMEIENHRTICPPTNHAETRENLREALPILLYLSLFSTPSLRANTLRNDSHFKTST